MSGRTSCVGVGMRIPTALTLILSAFLYACGGGGGSLKDGTAENSSPPPGAAAPVIDAQPTLATVPADSPATFAVSASGSGKLSYQWRRNGMAIEGATGDRYTTDPVAVTESGDTFDVVVSNDAGNVTSSAAALSVTLHEGANRFAGKSSQSGSSDGQASVALFNAPAGIVVDSGGNIYVADRGNFTIRRIDASNNVITFAGSAGQSGYVDGQGTQARFGGLASYIHGFQQGGGQAELTRETSASGPSSLALDAAQNLILADRAHNVIRKITPAGLTSTLAGKADTPGLVTGDANTARLNELSVVAVDARNGTLFFQDYENGVRYGIRSTPLAPAITVGPVRDILSVSMGVTDMSVDSSGTLYAVSPDSGFVALGTDGSVRSVHPSVSGAVCRPSHITPKGDGTFYIYDACALVQLLQVTAGGDAKPVVDLRATLGNGATVQGLTTWQSGKSLLVTANNAIYVVPLP